MYCEKCGHKFGKKDIVCQNCGRTRDEFAVNRKPLRKIGLRKGVETKNNEYGAGDDDNKGDEYFDGNEYEDEYDGEYDGEYEDEYDDDEEYEENERQREWQNRISGMDVRKPKKRIIAFLLAFVFGFFGAHRFYMGLHKSAILIIILAFPVGALTGGISEFFVLIWVLADCVLILMRKLKTADGRTLE